MKYDCRAGWICWISDWLSLPSGKNKWIRVFLGSMDLPVFFRHSTPSSAFQCSFYCFSYRKNKTKDGVFHFFLHEQERQRDPKNAHLKSLTNSTIPIKTSWNQSKINKKRASFQSRSSDSQVEMDKISVTKKGLEVLSI